MALYGSPKKGPVMGSFNSKEAMELPMLWCSCDFTVLEMLQFFKSYLMEDKDRLSYKVNNMAADERRRNEPRHQQPWYWSSSAGILGTQH